MSKLLALVFLAAVLAVASAQYLAAYPRAGLVGAPVGLGYAGRVGYAAGYPGYAGAYAAAPLGYSAYGRTGLIYG